MIAVGVHGERSVGRDLDLGPAQDGHAFLLDVGALEHRWQVSQVPELADLLDHTTSSWPSFNSAWGARNMPPPYALLLAAATL